MARKTIKGLEEVIKDLEERLKVQTEANSKLVNDMGAMQEKADNSFLNSALHKQLLRDNRKLKATIESKDRIIKQLESNKVQKIKNERGGGRKPKINDVIIDQVKELRLQGKSIRAIALDVNLSVGSVQKIVNEHLRRG